MKNRSVTAVVLPYLFEIYYYIIIYDVRIVSESSIITRIAYNRYTYPICTYSAPTCSCLLSYTHWKYVKAWCMRLRRSVYKSVRITTWIKYPNIIIVIIIITVIVVLGKVDCAYFSHTLVKKGNVLIVLLERLDWSAERFKTFRY